MKTRMMGSKGEQKKSAIENNILVPTKDNKVCLCGKQETETSGVGF